MQSGERLAILTSGGDAPGMNSAIRAATMFALSRGVEVVGVQQGYRGLIDGTFVPLGAEDVAGIHREGGTMLGSARCLDFLERDARDQARAHLRDARIGGLLVIGGNGSLAGARALTDHGELAGQELGVIGVPASIDNDIGLTGMSIGVDTAMNTIVDACDKISDTAAAHARTFVVEVMGRECGYLAMTSAIATGADAVLFRESGKDENEVVDAVVRTIAGARSSPRHPKRVLIIKAEGVNVTTERLKQLVDERLHREHGGGALIETRIAVLGHIVRGGRPSAFDRLLASRLAHVGVRALVEGETRKLAAWSLPVEPPDTIAHRSAYDPYCWLIDLDAVLAETARLLDGSSPLAQWRKRIFEEVEDALRF